MRIRIDDYCARCGICIDLFPELFERNIEEDCIDVKHDPVPEELKQKAIEAAQACCVTAIKLRDADIAKADSGIQETQPYQIDRNECEGCGVCAVLCPAGCIYEDEQEKKIIDSSCCLGCGTCMEACPAYAIKNV